MRCSGGSTNRERLEFLLLCSNMVGRVGLERGREED